MWAQFLRRLWLSRRTGQKDTGVFSSLRRLSPSVEWIPITIALITLCFRWKSSLLFYDRHPVFNDAKISFCPVDSHLSQTCSRPSIKEITLLPSSSYAISDVFLTRSWSTREEICHWTYFIPAIATRELLLRKIILFWHFSRLSPE